MTEIFKINLEPNIDYENTSFDKIKIILKNWRLNISEEIKCLLFIKNKIELNENNNDDDEENININQNIYDKYTKIFNKLEELCFQEINLISETIVKIDEVINNEKESIDKESNKELNKDEIYDKINFTLNNYNKIIENINKTISSLPYILNLYLLYNKTEEEENNYIRDNIKDEEEKYNSNITNYNTYNKNNKNKNNNKSMGKIKTINTQNNNNSIISKRERMVKFSKSVKSTKNYKKYNKNIKNNKNSKININLNKITIKNDNIRQNLKEIISDTEIIKDELKDYVYNNCVKENEMKNYIKIKEDNIKLNEEIMNIKNSMRELKNLYEYQLERLECLKNEQIILEKENKQLCEYINQILFNEEQKINNDNDIDSYKLNNIDNNNISPGKDINQNIYNNSNNITENQIINITPNKFESIEMFKRLKKL